MAGFKETITKAIGNSELFNKTADFLSDKQRKFKANKALEDANLQLTALYLELGKTCYKRKPLSPGRTSTVIRKEIDEATIKLEECQALVDELNAPKSEDDLVTETEDSSCDDKTEE